MQKRWGLILVVLLLGFWGCSEDITDPPAENPFADLATLGEAYINGTAPGVLVASDIVADVADGVYTVLDFRGTDDYAIGHIPGAIDASLGTLVDNVATYDEGNPFLCVCYSGQSAGHAVFALQMLGYDAYSLKWGMAGWHTDYLGTWTNNIADQATPVTDAAPELTTTYDFPTLDSYVLEDRVAAMLDAGFKGKKYADMVLDGLENYFIVNYFSEADYLGSEGSDSPGHIDGAYQFTPQASLGHDELLEYLPTDMPVIIYCWTGQHGSQVVAYLNMLGYEAYGMKFGSNNLWHAQLTGHKWVEHSNTYPLE